MDKIKLTNRKSMISCIVSGLVLFVAVLASGTIAPVFSQPAPCTGGRINWASFPAGPNGWPARMLCLSPRKQIDYINEPAGDYCIWVCGIDRKRLKPGENVATWKWLHRGPFRFVGRRWYVVSSGATGQYGISVSEAPELNLKLGHPLPGKIGLRFKNENIGPDEERAFLWGLSGAGGVELASGSHAASGSTSSSSSSSSSPSSSSPSSSPSSSSSSSATSSSSTSSSSTSSSPLTANVNGDWEMKADQFTAKLELRGSEGRIFYHVVGRWEKIDNVSFNAKSGMLTFRRPEYKQEYRGQLVKPDRLEGRYVRSSGEGYDGVWYAGRNSAGTTGAGATGAAGTAGSAAGSAAGGADGGAAALGGSIMTQETSWIVDHHPVPWVFHKDGIVEAPGLWKGTWTIKGSNLLHMTLTHQGASDEFDVRFDADGKSFEAIKNGQVYRHGVRK